jgi:hypothetical protein
MATPSSLVQMMVCHWCFVAPNVRDHKWMPGSA